MRFTTKIPAPSGGGSGILRLVSDCFSSPVVAPVSQGGTFLEDSMRHEIVRYVKGFESVDSVKEDVYLGVIVAIGRGQVGWAKTHENDRDKWSRKKGLLIALRRAALPMGEHRDRMMADLPDSYRVPVTKLLADSLKLPLWTGKLADGKKKDVLTGSEAVFGFCAWLTSQQAHTHMGSSLDAAVIVQLIGAFNEANNLAEPRENYTDYLTMPEDPRKDGGG